MIQIFADGELTYDSRLEDYDLLTLKITAGVNKGGTAEIVMPTYHPAYSRYLNYRTVVEIYRDGALRFRGRVFYTKEDFNNSRTVICEGELCFLQDVPMRPYAYSTNDPAEIFSDVITRYNQQVEAFKRFEVGTVDVLSEGYYDAFASSEAETVLATVNKLIERQGGYIVFGTNAEGKRTISWRASISRQSGQEIEFGENLLDFSRSNENTEMATAILPYGAMNDETGRRVTIEDVNEGVDFIVDEEAQARRGVIMKIAVWDDVTQSNNLLARAQRLLDELKKTVTSMTLTALDLSYVDKTVDSFQLGDLIRVRSRAHELDDDFQLTDIAEDLLNPASSTITLGKKVDSLTSLDVAGDNKSLSDIQKVTNETKKNIDLNVQRAITETETRLTTLIEQTSEEIRAEVAETYTTSEQVTEHVSTAVSQTSDQFLFEFNVLKASMDEADVTAQAQLTEIYNYISFEGGAIKLGAGDSALTLTLENDMIVFKKNGATFGWWDGVDFHTGNIVIAVNERAQLGNFAFVPRSNGSLSFLKVGG